MLKQLHMSRFKSFESATMKFGDFTALLGVNASGKSNARDALRFLHGVSRGYSLAEVIGEKWIEGGVLQWRGVRGGSRQIVREGARSFRLTLEFTYLDGNRSKDARYSIEVDIDPGDRIPKVTLERLILKGPDQYVFDSHPDGYGLGSDQLHISARVRRKSQGAPRSIQFLNTQPILSQLPNNPAVLEWAGRNATAAMTVLGSMRFLDLSPDAARQPSLAGLTTLGDRGENLSSVLQAITSNEGMKEELAAWVGELTPLDARDFEFESDSSGRVLAILVEANGRRTPLTTASDGTVRFLATISALLGPEPARFSFFEEIENGIHPSRLHLLLELMERSVASAGTQVAATTHSPYLLPQMSVMQRQQALLCFRNSEGDSSIVPIMELPGAQKVLTEHDPARLMASGWFEDTVDFAELGLENSSKSAVS
ncbi:AAA family ATPase [Actinomycetospora straminea]|uniref:ATP-binding protein n=1 Tax=Actinomycetospora straminea TaxID=663607 RepID=A0ABP9FB63_9PSEU|nr:ATP-binding protein [Actinomycetospora straminea]MDD7933712.1 ATP-binding protein [Actinomycetospora straminea]